MNKREMTITEGPRGILQIDNARITYRNFSGAPSDFNRAGDRSFSVVIPTLEMADWLAERGWNVKVKDPRVQGEDPFITLKVKVAFKNGNGPRVYLSTGKTQILLNEGTIEMLDGIGIENVSLDIRPYNYTVSGRSGIAAYLHAMKVEQQLDRFAPVDDFNDVGF